MGDFAKDLREARPRLIQVSPLRHFEVLGMAVFNFLIGYSLYIQHDNFSLPIYNHYFNSSFYGVVFGLVGVLLLFGLMTNRWSMMRGALLMGLFLKSLFAYSLIAIGLKIGWKSIVGVTSIWLLIMWIQLVLYLFFSVSINGGYENKQWMKPKL